MPKVLFMVNAKLLPNELSTCVCRGGGGETFGRRRACGGAGQQAGLSSSQGSGKRGRAQRRGYQQAGGPGPPGAHLGGEVHDGVDLLGLQHKADEVHRLDVALDKLGGRDRRAGAGDGHSSVAVSVQGIWEAIGKHGGLPGAGRQPAAGLHVGSTPPGHVRARAP